MFGKLKRLKRAAVQHSGRCRYVFFFAPASVQCGLPPGEFE